MPGASKLNKKEAYDAKLCSYLDEFDKAFIVHADNVGSKQFMDIRRGLREHSQVLMGKNTMMKRSVRLYCERSGDDTWASLLPYLVGNVGLVFTKGDLNDVRSEIHKFQVGAPARVGLVAPISVLVPAGNTGLDPSQTSFFQALNIPTKINRGTVEIVSDVQLINKAEKVGASEATLLAKLGIKPFSYGLVVQNVVENGAVFDPAVLDITDDDLMKTVSQAINTVAAASLGLSYPAIVAVPHLIINGFKNVLAVAVESENYSFPQADKVKEFLANPDAFVAAAPAADDGGKADDAGAPAAKKEEEPEEESDDDMGFSLFD